MKPHTLSFLLATATAALAESHAWHFQSGATFEGEFVRLVGTNNIVVQKAGKEYSLPLAKLSLEDQQFAARAKPAPEKAAVEVFGVRLGQKYVEGMATRVEHKAPEGFASDGFPSFVEYVFTPQKPLKGFTHYSLCFTPKSKLICTVVASADYPSLDHTPYKLDSDLAQALREKYGEPKEESTWIGGEALKTSVYTKGTLWIRLQHPSSDDAQIARLAGMEPKTHIALSYGDTALNELGEKETPKDEQVESLKKQL